MSEARIRFEGVGKSFRRRHLGGARLRDFFSAAPSPSREESFWALRDVSFEVDEGEHVAILGQNGSGKSTTLGLVAGACHPTSGRVSLRGRIAPLLSLGVGFEPDMSAVENAFVCASLLGVSRAELSTRLEEILAFADLGEVVDTPVRHFSTGMTARLGFAVAMHVAADILLIDEILSVGDGAFQDKCMARIATLREGGCSMLFVTHDLEAARRVATRAIWLRNGQIEMDGEVGACADAYQAFLDRG